MRRQPSDRTIVSPGRRTSSRLGDAPLDPRLARVVAFAGNQQGVILDARRLADMADMSYAHFLRSFREATGETVGGFVRRLRLSAAADRLRDGSETVAQVAQDAGYSSQATFTRAFVNAFGHTPGAHRASRSATARGDAPPPDGSGLQTGATD